ncbi:MAG: hypothetical protein HQL95_11365 [Magnetococcales bacterium]|nr:hypothetical protein [Magnetococcales bacterium]
MIYEYALDPEMVASWHDRKKYAFFAGRFGMDDGRVVSGYPKKWRQMVRKAFFDQIPGGDPNAEMRLNALLDTLCEKMVKRNNSFPDLPSWLEKAEYEHAVRPFRSVLSNKNPRSKPFVVTTDEVTGGTIAESKNADHWIIPPAPSPPRDASEFAQAVAPMLRCCQHAVFVDPYFDPDPYRPRFLNTLREMLVILWSQNHGMELPQAELHISADKKGENEILRKCRAHLPDIIPLGGKIRVVIWKSRACGEQLHNRYLLTDIGSVGFCAGLDETDQAGHDESDDLFRLSSHQHTKRWGQYVSAPAFEEACPPIELSAGSS